VHGLDQAALLIADQPAITAKPEYKLQEAVFILTQAVGKYDAVNDRPTHE
jgi:hypothetical protein